MHVLIVLLLLILVAHIVPAVGRLIGCLGWLIIIFIILAVVCGPRH